MQEVAIRISDHIRVAVAIAKSTLHRKRALQKRNESSSGKGGNDEEAFYNKLQKRISKLQSEVILIAAETLNARGHFQELFGNAKSDMRTRKQDELLEICISRGNQCIEDASQIVGENLRLVKLEASTISY